MKKELKKNMGEGKTLLVFSIFKVKALYVKILNNMTWFKLKTRENNSNYYHDLKSLNVIRMGKLNLYNLAYSF